MRVCAYYVYSLGPKVDNACGMFGVLPVRVHTCLE